VQKGNLLVMQVPLSARLAEQEATLPLLDHLRVSIAQVGVTYLYQVIQQITTTQAIVCCVVQGRRMMWKVLDRARIVMPDLQVQADQHLVSFVNLGSMRPLQALLLVHYVRQGLMVLLAVPLFV
jgi:hypothetical protein